MEKFNNSKETIDNLQRWGSAKIDEWRAFLMEAGLTDEYQKKFEAIFDDMEAVEISVAEVRIGFDKASLLSRYRTKLIDGIGYSGTLSETLEQIGNNRRLNMRIEADQEDLDAANFYELVREQTFSEDVEE